ncbi:MAG: ParA family protein [Oscillospiraceae bacterium]|nr:ParA family protein [Oscillospiraceae bacterium]
MTTIAFYNNKGGVGKTTTAINVANELAEKHRILVIDLDGQANSSRFFAEPKAGLETALVKKNFSPDVAHSNTRYPNIDVLTSTSALNLVNAQFEQLSDEEQTANIRKVLSYGSRYDYVLLDLPPALTKITEKVITLCDCVYVPIELSTFAIQGIPTVTGALTNCNAQFGGCIVNKFDKENPSDNELLELLKSMLGNKVLKTTVPFSRVIKNSFSFRLTAKEYMKWTAAATAFENLAAEIIERTENGI